MADYIRREDALSAILAEPTDAHYPEWYVPILMGLPAADVAEAVHCEGCKHSYTKNRPCDTALFRWCRK